MRRTYTALIAATGLSLAGLAGASPAFANPHPAQNAAQCAAVNGTFVSGSPNTCTVATSTSVTTYAGNSDRGWTVTTTSTTVWTRSTGGGQPVETGPTPGGTTTECENPGGHSMDPDRGQC
jgi:hypothetical protein